MGMLMSLGRTGPNSESTISTNQNTNSNETNTTTTASNIPNSRLNLIYNQITSSAAIKSKRKKSRNDLFNVSFSAYFFIAGRRFKNLMNSAQSFLFGDQLDLSFILAHKPVNFPHEVPALESPSKYLQSLVNIRKDTVKLIKCPESSSTDTATKYNIEFRFDCDCDVKIKIHYFATEKFTPNQTDPASNQSLTYTCGCTKFTHCFCLVNDENNEPIVYRKGANILFQNQLHFIQPENFHFNNWQFNINSNYYPIVIECRPLVEPLASNHAHITLAYIDKTVTNKTQPDLNAASRYSINTQQFSYAYQIKPIKQKQFIDGVLYSLQEIYGIEKKSSDDDLKITTDLCASQTSSSIVSTSLTATNSNSTTTSTTTTSSSKRIAQDNESIDSACNNINPETDEKKRRLEQEIEQELKGIECVICMCETRDTLILPCRHLCLCKLCAINLRIQSNNCPICRIPFIALIQLKLLRKKETQKNSTDMSTQLPVLKIENLNMVFNEDNLIVSENAFSQVQEHATKPKENGIIEETYHIRSENDNDNFISREIIVANENKLRSPRLLDLYEHVSIYEAFNESDLQNLKQNQMKVKKSKKSKVNKQTSLPIENETQQSASSQLQDTVINLTENQGIEIVKQDSLLASLYFNKNNNVAGANSRILPYQTRSSSVLVNSTEPKHLQPKSVRSASYIGNFSNEQPSQLQEAIQMGDI